MIESTYKILKLDWKTPGFFFFQKKWEPYGGWFFYSAHFNYTAALQGSLCDEVYVICSANCSWCCFLVL